MLLWGVVDLRHAATQVDVRQVIRHQYHFIISAQKLYSAMPAKSIPYGISDYEKIVRKGHAYVDKTMYVASLETTGDYLLFLRPRRFGKTLFTSMLGYYYDIAQKDNFDLLFSSTYIGQNPTEEKSAYYVLKFNFSGIRTDSFEIMLDDFTRKAHNGLRIFCATVTIHLSSLPIIFCFSLFSMENSFHTFQ
jgi:hypothetical protein